MPKPIAMPTKNPTLTQAIRRAQRIASKAFKEDPEVRVKGITEDSFSVRSFCIEIKTRDGEKYVHAIAKAPLRPLLTHEPGAERVLVRLRCVMMHGTKDKTRMIPRRNDRTINDDAVRRAIVETVQLAKDDLAYSMEREHARINNDRLRQETIGEIEELFPGTFARDQSTGLLYTWGHIKIQGTGTMDDSSLSVSVSPGGKTKLEVTHLEREDVLDLMERLLRPDGYMPAADTRRPHEKWPDRYEKVEGKPGVFKYVGANKSKTLKTES